MSMRQTYVVWAPADAKPEVLERHKAVLHDDLENITRVTRLASAGSLSVFFGSCRDTKHLPNNDRAGRPNRRSCIR